MLGKAKGLVSLLCSLLRKVVLIKSWKHELRQIAFKRSGSSFISNLNSSALKSLLGYSPCESLIRDRLQQGFEFIYDPRMDIGRSLFLTGSFEPGVLAVIRKWVKQGDIALDIGGNWGLHTVLLSRIVRTSGFVYVFEPYGPASDILVKNIQLNRLQNVELMKSAVGDCTGKIDFNAYDDPAYCSINRTDRKQLLKTIQVDITSVDDFVESRKLNRLDFMKIDVEGYEDKVIEGARMTIARLRPVIVCEISEQNKLAVSPDQLISTIASLGYKPFVIGDRGVHPYDKYVWYREDHLFVPTHLSPRAE